ncbi:hypothetical protein E4T49_03739 [Aureobasidium sp. EXF-10728]|nr:hypothetical protein E4T49_03739 [Aureobasidium sp. EXF-10728]
MDLTLEEKQALEQQQQDIFAQVQIKIAPLATKEEPFEDLEWRYLRANVEMLSAIKRNNISPEEQTWFDQLEEQYLKEKTRREELKNIQTRDVKVGVKNRRASPSMFVQQDEPDSEAGYDAANGTAGSKRKRGKTLETLPKRVKSKGISESIKRTLESFIADAAEDKRQAAIQDCARIMDAIKQFPQGTVEYRGEGLWAVAGLATSLKNHQLLDVGWMRERETSREGPKGGLQAAKMGLGKTICSLANMVLGNASAGSKGRKTNLVVVPKVIKGQWLAEALEHTKRSTTDDNYGLNNVILYSSDLDDRSQKKMFEQADLVVVTYPELVSAFKDVKYPRDLVKAADAEKEKYFDDVILPTLPEIFHYDFRAVYLDEGHTIRNSNTNAAAACQKLKGKYRWVLTGTPMTNDPADLYSVLTFIRHPEVIKLTLKEFKAYYIGNSKTSKNNIEEIDLEWLATLLSRCMRVWAYTNKLFGRKLTEILDPIIKNIRRDLSKPERIIFSVVRKRLRYIAIETSDDPEATKAYRFVKGLFGILRQMTGHVLLIRPTIFKYLTDEDVDTIENRIREDTQAAMDSTANDYIVAVRELQRSITCVVCEQRAKKPQWAACGHVYCGDCVEDQTRISKHQNLRGTPCKLCGHPIGRLIGEPEHDKSRWLNGSGKVIHSTKSAEVVKLLKAWRDPISGNPGAKAIVFTSYKDSHNLLRDAFLEEQWSFTVLTAAMSDKEKNASLSKFKTDSNIYIMLATSGVAGSGLNMEVARYLINYDQYFNKSTEEQAWGRILRIGQTEKVTIVSLTATGTVDEHIESLRLRKTGTINKVLHASKKKNLEALLKMFERAKKNKDIAGSEWADEIELEDNMC